MRKNSEHLKLRLLVHELQTLRKGVGLTEWKLEAVVGLRHAIAEQTGIEEESLSARQAHAYLVSEIDKLGATTEATAVRNAFALGQTTSRKLMERREHLSRQLNRHIDTVEAYENRGITQIANRLRTPAQSSHQAQDSFDEETLTAIERKTNAARNMVTRGLADLYALGARAPEKHIPFGSHASPYLDASTTMTFLPSKRGSDWYCLKIRQIFRAALKEYRIAIVSSVQDGETLMASRVVDDVIKLDKSYEHEIEKVLDNCRLIRRDATKRTQQSFYFKRVDENVKHKLLDAAWQVAADNCEIIEVTLPDNLRGRNELYEYQWTTESQTHSEQYAYWYAQGLMYLNHLTVDISRFPEYGKWSFAILPFLGPFFPGNVEPTNDHYTLATSGWVMEGQGVAVTWYRR